LTSRVSIAEIDSLLCEKAAEQPVTEEVFKSSDPSRETHAEFHDDTPANSLASDEEVSARAATAKVFLFCHIGPGCIIIVVSPEGSRYHRLDGMDGYKGDR